MRVIMLGTGAALVDPDRHHSAILVTVEGRHYLLDCGHGATRQMVRAGVDPATVDVVLLSHLHYDHIADFGYFMISTWMVDRANPPVVVGPPGTRRYVDHLLAAGAFAKDIEARAQYPRRRQNLHVLTPDVRECEPGVVFRDDLVTVRACYVEHIPREISPCFGLRLDTASGKSVVFSGDTSPCERLVELAADCDLLIHECTFPEKAIEFRSKIVIGTWEHTSPLQLGDIAVRARAKALVATHFGHFDTTNPVLKKHLAKHMPIELVGPEFTEDVVTDIRKAYKGPLHIARDLMRIDV
jgi:ribonuclease Z